MGGAGEVGRDLIRSWIGSYEEELLCVHAPLSSARLQVAAVDMTALGRASPCSRGGFGSNAGIAMGEQGQPDGGCGGAGEEDEGVGVGGGAARLPTGEWKRGMASRYSPPPRPRRLQRHHPRLLHHSSDYNSSCPCFMLVDMQVPRVAPCMMTLGDLFIERYP